MSGKYVLSIDQGTTGTSVLIFDFEGELRSRAYSEFTQYYPRPGWVEHDVSEIWQVSISVIAEALEAGVRAGELAPTADTDVAVNMLIGSFYAIYVSQGRIPQDWPQLALDLIWPTD